MAVGADADGLFGGVAAKVAAAVEGVCDWMEEWFWWHGCLILLVRRNGRNALDSAPYVDHMLLLMWMWIELMVS